MPDTHTFTAPVEILEKGMRWHVVFIPGDVAEDLELSGITRVVGKIGRADYRRAAVSDGNGRYYITLGKDLRQAAGCREGQMIQVSVAIDPNPDYIEVPEELEAALDTDPEALEIWNGFTNGYRRSLVHYVSGAKRTETRIKRALELCEKMKQRGLHGQQ